LYLTIIKNVNNRQGDFIMLSFIKKIFGAKPEEVVAEVPYKVEAKVEQPTPVAQKATEVAVKSVATPAKKTAPKKQGGVKPAGAKKGPRKPKSKTQA
jgi:hypothetical protein